MPASHDFLRGLLSSPSISLLLLLLLRCAMKKKRVTKHISSLKARIMWLNIFMWFLWILQSLVLTMSPLYLYACYTSLVVYAARSVRTFVCANMKIIQQRTYHFNPSMTVVVFTWKLFCDRNYILLSFFFNFKYFSSIYNKWLWKKKKKKK